MYNLPILLSLTILASAKTIYLENDFEEVLPAIPHNQDIWVLKFDDDFEVNPLRPPNKVELKIFIRSIEPVIKRNRRIQKENENAVDFNDNGEFRTARVKPDQNYNATVEEIKLELKEIINKFLHSIVEADPTQSISSKRDKNTSLKIFFERNSSALVLQSGRYRNVYYNDAEDGLFPKWFFEEHDNIECDAKGDFVNCTYS